MSFKPYTEEHSIQEIGFAFMVSRDFSPNEIAGLRARRNEIRLALPAISSAEDDSGIEFAYLRPNGSAAWLLKVSENTILVECTRYTRWYKIWPTAQELASFVLSGLDLNEEVELLTTGLQVVDVFRTEEENGDVSSLFKDNEYLPRAFFEMDKRIWSSQLGWLEDSKFGTILNNMSVEGRTDNVFIRDARETKQFNSIVVKHAQQLQFDSPMDILGIIGQETNRIEVEMNHLHERNKQFMDRLLTDEMKTMIQLWRQET